MGKVISLESRRRDHVRRRDIGQGGNGGKFASILRAEPGIAVLDDEPCPLDPLSYDPAWRWPARGSDGGPVVLREEARGRGLDRAQFDSRADLDLDGALRDYEAALSRRLPPDISLSAGSWSCTGGRSEEEVESIAREVIREACAQDAPKIVAHRRMASHPVPTPVERGWMTPGRAARRYLLAEDLSSRGYRLPAAVGQDRAEDIAEVFDAEGADSAARYIEALPDQEPWGSPGSRERVMMVEAFRDALLGRCPLSREERSACLDDAEELDASARRAAPGSPRWLRDRLASDLRASQAASAIREPGSPERSTEKIISAVLAGTGGERARRGLRAALLDDAELCSRTGRVLPVGEGVADVGGPERADETGEPNLPTGFTVLRDGERIVVSAPEDYRREIEVGDEMVVRHSAKAIEREVRRGHRGATVEWR